MTSAAVLIEWGERLAQKAGWSANNRTLEADLRADLFLVLGPYAVDELEVPPADVRQEGTGRAGRFDSLFGRCVVEYKRPGLLRSDAEKEKAATQAIGYLEDPGLGAAVVIVTDGETWGLLRDEEAGPEEGEQGWLDFGLATPIAAADRFAWRPNSAQTCSRVLTLLSTVRTAPVSVVSLTDRLGIVRPEVVQTISALADSLEHRAVDSRADVLFKQWLQLAGVAYGIDGPNAAWPKKAETLLGPALAPVLGSRRYAEAVFCLHSYVAFAAKVIAAEVLALVAGRQSLRPSQWASLDDPGLAKHLGDLESGAVTEQMRAPDLLAGDVFGWYVPLLTPGSPLLTGFREILHGHATLAWARLANARGVAGDLLREFYAATIPPLMRRALGEFFTPQWLAERVLLQALDLAELPIHKRARILDPACGSGTFLVAALRRALASALARGKTEAEAALEAVDSVYGCDINPVAVLMARVNLLLALGDRVDLLPSVSFHVYQTDSILLPDIVKGQQYLGADPDVRRLPLQIGDVDVPESMATAEGLHVLRSNIEQAIRANRSEQMFSTRIAVDLAAAGIDPDGVEIAAAGAVKVYRRVRELAAAGNDGIWGRVIEQAFAPALMEPVDLVVGNPPWINWKHLPEAWQQRSRRVWESWGLWQTKTKGGGLPLADISSLLLARSVMSYCKPKGVVALLLPQSVLLADPGARSIRRCDLGSAVDVAGSVRFRPLAVDDFSALHPFSPDAANNPVALYLRTHQRATFPIPQTNWTRAVARVSLPAHDPWTSVVDRLSSTNIEIGPLHVADISSPWARVATDVDLELQPPTASPTYTWGQGFHSRGADGLLFVEVITPTPIGASGLVRIRSVPSVGKNTKGEAEREADIEAEFLWPMLRGQNVMPFAAGTSGLYTIVTHDPDDLTKILTVNQLAARAPRLFDYLEPWLPRLEARSPYQELQPTIERPWGIQGPWGHLRRDAHLVVSRYIHAERMPPAAPLAPTFDLNRPGIPGGSIPWK